jgi:rubrerythrin
MAEHIAKDPKKQDERSEKQRIQKMQSESSCDLYNEMEWSASPLTETPFRPQKDIHAEFSNNTVSDTQRAIQAMHLQKTYGNRYVQRLAETTNLIQREDIATCEVCGAKYDMEKYGETCPECGKKEPLVSLEHGLKQGPKTGEPDMATCEACGAKYDMDKYGETCPECGKKEPLSTVKNK